jgi:hypothetical protein
MSLPGTFTPTLTYFGLPSVKLFEPKAHGLVILLKLGALPVDAGSKHWHAHVSVWRRYPLETAAVFKAADRTDSSLAPLEIGHRRATDRA